MMEISQPIPEGKVQDIRAFTAQVRNKDDAVLGTAFAIDRKRGLLVTCRHVVRDASEDEFGIGAKVWVYFPQIPQKEKKQHLATVCGCFTEVDDDVAILQLENPPLPSGVEKAVIGTAEHSVGFADYHRFRSFGFQQVGEFLGLPASGEITGFADKPEKATLLCDPLALESQNIDKGMSGAAVLDLKRNLVVGIISKTSVKKLANRDLSIAVDGEVLTEDPLSQVLHPEDSLPVTQDPPVTELAQKQSRAAIDQKVVQFPLPPVYRPSRPPDLPEWAGRARLLEQLDKDWQEPSVHLTGLIGFGGEGKSSLAYRWLSQMLENEDLPKPEALFWWNFYDNRSFEDMLEGLMTYLYGAVVTTQLTGSRNRVEAIGAMATQEDKRVLLVLDGFEVMQEQAGDRYGEVRNSDLRRLLEIFAGPGHESYCLITSRAPLLDLLSYTAYVQRDVTRLSDDDGRTLLKNVLELEDDKFDSHLDQIVSDWEGHALTLSLIGAYLKEVHYGDASQYSLELFPDITGWEGQQERYKRVNRVLVRYDESLTEADKAFLKLFSVFRLPVSERAFPKVFRTHTSDDALNAPLVNMTDEEFNTLVEGLVARRLIRETPRQDEETYEYSAHPLVRNHYLALLAPTDPATTQAHKDVAKHYQDSSEEPGRFPTLDDLRPYIEVVHHLCRAGAYDEAHAVRRERVSQGTRFVIEHRLGAYETTLNLMLEFFPDGDTSQDPKVSDPGAKRFILNHTGYCLMTLGRLRETPPFYERATAMCAKTGDHHNAAIGYRNLAELYAHLGELAQSVEAARQGLEQAGKVANERNRNQDECTSLVSLAWVAHLRGETTTAGEHFQAAEALEREIDPEVQYLYSIDGIRHADHLRRTGQADTARRVTEANLVICRRNSWVKSVSQCHRVLGDLEADAGEHNKAQEHYDQALAIAQSIQLRFVLIEALLARGLWWAKHMKDHQAAFGDLNEALGYCEESGYRRYEADTRVALAWAHLRAGDLDKAKDEANRAKAMSEEMGYHWGQVDAEEVLAEIEQSTPSG